MASRKAAEHTLYHLSPKGFWKKLRDATVVNPEISSGLPLPSNYRMPPPASRPELYATPASKASDPAQNPYWKRDVRRAYPQLSVVTQSELATFLLQSPQDPSRQPQQGAEKSTETAAVPARTPDLNSAISSLYAAKKAYSKSSLPPVPRTSFKRWSPETSPPAPHDPNAYFPMDLIR